MMTSLKGKVTSIIYSAILVVSILIMLLAIRFTVTEGHEEIQETVVINISSMQKSFRKGADTVMRDAGQEIIRLKAEKVAKGIENYLIRRPRATIKSMQNDPEFKAIAIQPVGKTGYTAVHEANTSINRFHANPKIVNTSLGALAQDLPDFWKIISASRNGEDAGGYYNWREADGRVRDKYMWVATVSRPTADGITLDVAATTYIDEFMQPFEQLTERLGSESAATSAKVSSMSKNIQYRTFIAIAAILLIFCGVVGYMAFRLIRGYRRIQLEIKNREKTEATLRHSEHRLKELIDFLPDPTFAIDGDKRVTVWNRAMEKMTGVPSAQMIGESNYAYTVPFYGERKPLLMDLLWEPGIEIEKRYVTVKKEGDSLTAEAFCPALYSGKGAYVYAKASPLHDMDGNIIGAIEAVRDITERKRIEESIREAKNKTDAILESSTNGIVTINEKGIVETFNPAAENIFGYESHEVTGKSISLLMPEEHADKHDNYLRNYLRTGVKKVIGKRLEVMAKRKNGELFPIEIGISEVSLQNARLFTAIINDITERKKAEEELGRKDRYLESVSRAVTELLVNPDLNEAMQKTLSILGIGTGHDRAYIFQNHINEDGIPLMSQRYEWAIGAVSAEIDNPAMQNLPYDGTFAQMYEKLINKEYFYGEIASFDDDTRQMLENQHILSIVIFPIFSSNEYWGFVGFDSSSKVREYSQSELSILYTFAETMGESVSMKKAEEELRQHTEDLEKFMKLTIDRELKMIELKKEINACLKQTGKEEKYEIDE